MGIGLIGLWVYPLPAQTAPGVEAGRLTADRLMQLAARVLDGPETAAQPALRIASDVLRQATVLAPSDPEVWRLFMEVQEALGETGNARQLLTGYLRAAPTDDAAQLRLVEMIAGREQTASGRAEVLERMIRAEGAAKLTPALRSRLAWQAAELRRAQGQTRQFHELLRLALELDSTNAAAAAATYELFEASERADVADRGQALLVWHKSDPANPAIHLRLAQTLLHCGQYTEAALWYESANSLLVYEPPLPYDQTVAVVGDWALAMWGSGRADEAVRFIWSSAGQEAAESTELPPQLQSVLVAIQSSAGKPDAAKGGFERLDARLGEDKDETKESELLAERAWARVLFNQGVAEAEPWVSQLRQSLDSSDPRRARIYGWWLLRSGRTDEASEVLAAQAGSDAPSALGLALCQTDRQAKAKALQDAWRLAPGSLIGLMAAESLRQLGERPQATDPCQALGRMARQIPDDLRRIAEPTVKFVSLRVGPLHGRFQYAQPITASVQLMNLSSLPLSVGPGGVVPATVLLIPRITTAQGQWQALKPQVLDAHRVIRLRSGETIEIEAQLTGADLVAALDDRPSESVQLAIEAVLNPRMDSQGRFIPGPLGTRMISRRFDRPGRPATAAQIESAIGKLAGKDAEAMLAAAWLVRAAAELSDEQWAGEERIVPAVRDYFEACDEHTRAWLVSYLPPSDAGRQRLAPVVEAAVRSKEPTVRQSLMLAVCHRPDDPVLTAALRGEPGPIHSFTQDLREILVARQAAAAEARPSADEPSK